ncbi:zinc finger protein 184 isoform X2 [Gouania willdenowi]|uniref:zinc finger protein 184 isoform X2 n=1 Tax=Gouania willdenowi TaxID=441366 RepID=UPI001056B89B|nr:zinc finger protein 184-like isoform X2 [Gouania willdenowi]
MDEPVSAEFREEVAETEPIPDQTNSEKHAGASIEHTADGCEAFCCQECGETFKEESSYLQHCLQHQPDNADLENHADGLRNVESDCNTPHYCALCSLSFVKQSDLDLHIKTHDAASPNQFPGQKSKKISRQPIHVCPDCGKAYKLLGLLRNHERTHRPPPKTYFSDLYLLKKKSFQCEICERSYTRASALDAHRRCHEENLVKPKSRSPGDERQTAQAIEEVKPVENQPADPTTPFDCACGKSFLSLPRLKTHQRFSRKCQCSPEKVKPKPKKTPDGFECSECQRTFSNKIASYNHQRWHANQANASANKFSCEECGKEFQSLSFFYKHQRIAHSGETPAKSFLHQVCQLQKKAIECEVCGLRFSRPSALHSHRLLHANSFKDEEKDIVLHSSLSPEKMSKFVKNEEVGIPTSMVLSDNLDLATMAEETHVGETEDDMEAYELSDFNVQVISASESEDEPIRDLNPDLELLCESDQEGKDEDAVEKGRFDCSECGGWYSSISSLHIHRRWHDAQKRRQQTEVGHIECKECGLQFKQLEDYTTHLHQHAVEDEEASNEDDEDNAAGHDLEEKDEEGVIEKDSDGSEKKRPIYCCSECGKMYTYLTAFRKHLQIHEKKSTVEKVKETSGAALKLYECPDCGKSFIRRTRLISHLRVHALEEEIQPKVPSCDQCNRSFNSVKSWLSHLELHKLKPFWCLSCSHGFASEMLLDRHLQNHKKQDHTLLKSPTGPKVFKCSSCEKTFSHRRKLFSHQKKHHGDILQDKSLLDAEMGEVQMESFPTNLEQLESNIDVEELPEDKSNNVEVELHDQLGNCDDLGDSEDSDCGEPSHCIKSPKPSDLAGPDQTEQYQTSEELNEVKSEPKMHREHKYWEWNCLGCDMGFDDVEELHQHYIKHATGEVPMLQFDIEG